jgi:hypothetical protein
LIVPAPVPSPHTALDYAPLSYNFAQKHFLADRARVLIQECLMKNGVDARLALVNPISNDCNALHPCFLGAYESAVRLYLVDSSLVRLTQSMSEKNVQPLPA